MSHTMRVGSPQYPQYMQELEEVDEDGNLVGLIDDGEDEDWEEKPAQNKRLRRKETPEVSQRREEKRVRFAEEMDRAVEELDRISRELLGKPVVGRIKEANQLIEMIELPKGGIRPLLVGQFGVGKKSTIEKVALQYKTVYKDRYPGRVIHCIDCSELLAKYNSSAGTDDVTEMLDSELELFREKGNKHPIFCFIDIDKLLAIEHVRDKALSHLGKQQPFIATTTKTAKELQCLVPYNFEAVEIHESPLEDVEQIVTQHLIDNPISPKIEYTKQGIELAVKLADTYVNTHPFPRKAINVIQQCANRALFQSNGLSNKIVITPKVVAEFMSERTRIDAEDLLDAAVFNKDRAVARLRKDIVGQDHALETACNTIATYKNGLLDSSKPWAVFCCIGPTGVGKTLFAKKLQKLLFREESGMLSLDGSEFSESHTISRLIGAPPGYQAHEQGGQLTEAMKLNPHRVVLFDEIEKAHPAVRMLLLQALDEGKITDGNGTTVYFPQSVFILTSNLGSDVLIKKCANKNLNPAEVKEAVLPLLMKELTPELCNRFTDIIPFTPLKEEHLPGVVDVQLKIIQTRLEKQTKIKLQWTDALAKHFQDLGFDSRFGMRKFCKDLDKTVTKFLQNCISEAGHALSGEVTLDFKNGKICTKEENIPSVVNRQLEIIKTRLAKQTKINLQWTDTLAKHFQNIPFDPKLEMSKFCDTIDETVTNFLQICSSRLGRALSGKVILDFKAGNITVRFAK